MKKNKKLIMVAFVMIMVLELIIVYKQKIITTIYCSKSIDKENVLQYVEFIGDVSDDSKAMVEMVLQEQVPEDALRFVINSGGKIRIVYNESQDLGEHILNVYNIKKNYNRNKNVLSGTATCFSDFTGDTYKCDVDIACDNIHDTELGHEFGHVYDYINGYLSQKSDFMKIYENREIIRDKIDWQYTDIDHAESTPGEYFAEFIKRYMSNQLERGLCSELDEMISYYDSLNLK